MNEPKQWFQHGDHEQVTYYPSPFGDGSSICRKCDVIMNKHGWINNELVCPGSWITPA